MTSRSLRQSHLNLKQLSLLTGKLPCAEVKSGAKKIEDFGEEIKGAAKHRYAQLAETLGKTLEDRDYATQPLSKLFPKPDYAKLANEGADADTPAMIALYRSDIPAKTKHNTAGWGRA